MISMKLLIYLSIGTIAMLFPIMLQAAWYKIRLWKSVPIAIALTISGTIGTYLWFFIENHWIGGTSFYGAVFVVPLIFLFIAKLSHMSYGDLIDLCAPAECVMLVIMKVQCIINGCCGGRALCVNTEGLTIYFPSQIAELINAFVICAILMIVAYRKINRGNIYPLYMLVYGVTRFILNTFRADQSEFLFGMPPGHVWSLLSVIIGILWLCVNRKKNLETY